MHFFNFNVVSSFFFFLFICVVPVMLPVVVEPIYQKYMCVKFLCRCRIIDLEELSHHFSKVGSPGYVIPERCLFYPDFFSVHNDIHATTSLSNLCCYISLESSPAHSIQSQLFLLQFKYLVHILEMENIILFLLMYQETAVMSPLSFSFPQQLDIADLYLLSSRTSRSIPEKATYLIFPYF